MSEATALVRLQEIDLALIRLKKRAESLPQRTKVAAARAASKKVAGQLTEIVGQRKDLEIELADLDDSKRFFTEKVGEVQRIASAGDDFRGSQTIEDQLSYLAKKLEKVDFDTDRLLAQLDRVERAEANARALQEKLAREEQALTESWQASAADITREVKQLSDERTRLVAEVSPELLKRYGEAKRRFGGVAVETLTGNRPSACRVALQPSSFSDIRRSGSEVTTCPYCKRILVISGEADA